MSLFDPIYLNSNLTKEQLKERYAQLYNTVLSKFESTEHIFREYNLRLELLNLYRKLYAENKDEINVKKIEHLEYEINEMKKDVELIKSAFSEFVKFIKF